MNMVGDVNTHTATSNNEIEYDDDIRKSLRKRSEIWKEKKRKNDWKTKQFIQQQQ